MTTTPPETDDELDGFNYDEPPVTEDDDINLERAVKAAEYAAYWHQRIMEIGDVYDAEHRRLEDKLDALRERREYEVGKLTRKLVWHQAVISEYHRKVLEENPRRKTIDLVHGSSKARVPSKPQVWFDPNGSEETLRWVREHHPELLRGPLISDVRRVVQGSEDGKVIDLESGEIVPGLIAQIPEPSYSFEPDGNGPF